MNKGLIIVIIALVVVFLSVLAGLIVTRVLFHTPDDFNDFDRKCREAGGQPLWTGNSYKNQIICLKKKLVIEVD